MQYVYSSVFSPVSTKHWLTELEVMASLFAAAIHDYEHTGTTNNFHIHTKYVSSFCEPYFINHVQLYIHWLHPVVQLLSIDRCQGIEIVR